MVIEWLIDHSWLALFIAVGQLDIAGALYKALQMQQYMQEQQARPIQGLGLYEKGLEAGGDPDELERIITGSYRTPPKLFGNAKKKFAQDQSLKALKDLSHITQLLGTQEAEINQMLTTPGMPESMKAQAILQKKRLGDMANLLFGQLEGAYGFSMQANPDLARKFAEARAAFSLPAALSDRPPMQVGPGGMPQPGQPQPAPAPMAPQPGVMPAAASGSNVPFGGGKEVMEEARRRFHQLLQAQTGGGFHRAITGQF